MKETEQTLLDQIKEDVAKDHEYSNFRQIFPDQQDFEHYSLIITEIANRYATAKAQASCEATLKRVLENLEFDEVVHPPNNDREIVVRKESVLNPSNIVIV